jgi:hypothetical protein
VDGRWRSRLAEELGLCEWSDLFEWSEGIPPATGRPTVRVARDDFM